MVRFSCKDCTTPKRHPGCHDKCPEYLEQKAKYDAQKAAYDEKRRLRGELIAQRDELYYKAMKKRRR